MEPWRSRETCQWLRCYVNEIQRLSHLPAITGLTFNSPREKAISLRRIHEKAPYQHRHSSITYRKQTNTFSVLIQSLWLKSIYAVQRTPLLKLRLPKFQSQMAVLTEEKIIWHFLSVATFSASFQWISHLVKSLLETVFARPCLQWRHSAANYSSVVIDNGVDQINTGWVMLTLFSLHSLQTESV